MTHYMGKSRWRGAPSGRWHVRLGLVALVALGVTGCSLDSLLKSDQLPPDVSDPAVTKTPAGARQAYYGTLAAFSDAFAGNTGSFAETTALLTDELTDPIGNPVDQRFLPEGSSELTDRSYSQLQKTRAQAGQAIALLADYLPDQPALAGHLYAIKGYTEVFLAELFCSGVPLSTVDYNGDYTYQPGSTTAQVLTHAIALFDTALTLAADSARIMDLARMGRGRALLGLGNYAEAEAVVTAVSSDYRYQVGYNDNTDTTTGASPNFLSTVTATPTGPVAGNWRYTIADSEGTHGLNWRTSGDPRTPIMTRGSSSEGILYYPSNYDPLGSTPIMLASGVEARLIEAEAQLHAGDASTWLATLNAIRTDGTFVVDSQAVVDNTVSPPDTTGWAYDTLWRRERWCGRAPAAGRSGDHGGTGGSAVPRARVLAVPHWSSRRRSTTADPAVRAPGRQSLSHRSLQIYLGWRAGLSLRCYSADSHGGIRQSAVCRLRLKRRVKERWI